MKQKILMKVAMRCEKCRVKAKKIAAGADGADSIALEGEEKNMVVVTGEGIDVTEMVRLMRKKVGPTALIKVDEVKAEQKKPEPKKEEKKPEPVKQQQQQVIPMAREGCYCPHHGLHYYVTRKIFLVHNS